LHVSGTPIAISVTRHFFRDNPALLTELADAPSASVYYCILRVRGSAG